MDSSTWLSGWIGGLLAAAVTISATIWWEARARRRNDLDRAVLALAKSSAKFADEVLEVRERTRQISALEAHLSKLGRDQLLVMALASRRVWHWRSRHVAPVRAGLKPTLARLFEALSEAMRDLPDQQAAETLDSSEWMQRVDPLLTALFGYHAACPRWMNHPWSFWPSRDLSGQFLRESKSSTEE